MEINVIVAISTAGVVCSILFGYIGYSRGIKKDSNAEGKNIGILMSDIGYIKAGVDDVKRKQETTEERHFALVERVKGVEEVAKSAHKRIDGLEVKEHV